MIKRLTILLKPAVLLAVLALMFATGALLFLLSASASPGTTERVSVDSAGNEANHISFDPAISTDGRFVAFFSHASNLVTGDTCCGDAFVLDRLDGTIKRVSVDSAGNQANLGEAQNPRISADGRFVVFNSGS